MGIYQNRLEDKAMSVQMTPSIALHARHAPRNEALPATWKLSHNPQHVYN